MKDKTIFIIFSGIILLGELFSLGIFLWQIIKAPYSFLFWFSIVSCFGYCIAISLMTFMMRILDNEEKKKEKKK